MSQFCTGTNVPQEIVDAFDKALVARPMTEISPDFIRGIVAALLPSATNVQVAINGAMTFVTFDLSGAQSTLSAAPLGQDMVHSMLSSMFTDKKEENK